MNGVLKPNATASLAFQGLSVFCFNPTYNSGQGRWEIAVPHFSKHEFLIRIPGAGVLKIFSSVKTIAIKARVGVPTAPKHMVNPFCRRDKINSDLQDCRWLTDFTNNTEIPHGTVSIIKKSDVPSRVDVTMVYVYQGIGYTKRVVETPLILANQADTCPIVGGEPRPLPNDQAGRVLDSTPDTFGFSADTFGIDIEGGIGGEAVDIILDTGFRVTIPKIGQPQEVLISNLESPNEPIDLKATVRTVNFNHGRGDFFHYYELFSVTLPPFHLWARRPPSTGPPPGDARTGDCNGIRVDFPNLGDLC